MIRGVPLFFLRKLSQNGGQFSQKKHDRIQLQTPHMWDSDECLGKAGMLCVIVR